MKKNYTTILLLAFITCNLQLLTSNCHAQYVTIPDAGFVTWLNANGFSSCMNGSQLDTTCAAVLNATSIECNSSGIGNLSGIRYFKSLRHLDCSFNNLGSLPVLPSSLDTLYCDNNRITSISSLPPGLVYLNCYSNLITSLPALPATLNTLLCRSNSLTALPSIPKGFIYLDCSENNITIIPFLSSLLQTLDVSDNANLACLPYLPIDLVNFNYSGTNVQCVPNLPNYYNYLTLCSASNPNGCTVTAPPNCVLIPDANLAAIFQSNYPSCMYGNYLDTTCTNILSATQLEVGYANIQNITGVQYFKHITYLECAGNHLTSLPKLQSSIKTLDVSYNYLSSITALPDSLVYLNCPENYLTSLPPLPSTLRNLTCGTENDTKIGNNLTSLPSLPPHLQILQVCYNDLSSLPALPNSITTIDCSFNNRIKTLPTLPDSLTSLTANYDSLLSFPALPSGLKTISATNNYISSLPSPLPDSLKTIYVDYNKLTSVPALPANLQKLSASYNSITGLPAVPQTVNELELYSNQLTSLPALPAALTYLDVSLNQLTSLPAIPPLVTFLGCWSNKLTMLPSLPAPLVTLYCDENPITTLPALPGKLTTLTCSSDSLTFLPDLPSVLTTLNCRANPKIVCLPVLPSTMSSLNFSSCGVKCMPNYPYVSGDAYPSISTVPLCNLLNTNNCPYSWNVSGRTYYDNNSNCTFDAGDVGLKNMPLQLYSGTQLLQKVFSSIGGVYSLVTGAGSFEIKVDTTGIPYTVQCPASAKDSVNIASGGAVDSAASFAMVCKNTYDVAVNSISLPIGGDFRIGRTSTINIQAGDIASWYGVSCMNGIGGVLKVVISGPVTYSSSTGTVSPSAVNGDTIVWNIADWSKVDFVNSFSIVLNVPLGTAIGSEICITANASSSPVDINPSNNTLTQCYATVYSHDPNFKEVFPYGSIDSTVNTLTYEIHFQNTGTAPAINVQVIDTLDPHLDPTSVKLLAYSHPNITQVNTDNSTIVFNFPNINLPDSTTDKMGSQGFVQFSINIRKPITIGTKIKNSSSIYFDSNAPIKTNTVTTLYCHPAFYNINQVVCSGSGFTFNGSAINTPGVYNATYPSASGCDSVVNLYLVVDTVMATIQEVNDTLMVEGTGTVQWKDCNSGNILTGDTGKVFIPTVPGSYAAILSAGNCSDTTLCITVVSTAAKQLAMDNESRWLSGTIYPNPANDVVNIVLSQQCNNCVMTLTDITGRAILQSPLSGMNTTLDLSSVSAGIYFVRVSNENGTMTKKIVKQ